MPRGGTPLPSTVAVAGLKLAIDFFRTSSFAQRRFAAHRGVFKTRAMAPRELLLNCLKGVL